MDRDARAHLERAAQACRAALPSGTLGVPVTLADFELRPLVEFVEAALADMPCPACHDTNRHHCTVCIAAGRA